MDPLCTNKAHFNRSDIKQYFYIFSLLFLGITPFAEAQEEIAHFQDFALNDGLSSTNVILFFQDSRGIIWIGTSYGLNRYDGASIKSYTKEDNGLCHNYIYNIAEDGKGNIWIQSGNYGREDSYFCILDPISEIIYSIEEYTGQPCPFDPNATSMSISYKGIFLLQEWKENKVRYYEVNEDKIEKGFSWLNSDDPLIFQKGIRKSIKLDEETYLFSVLNEDYTIKICLLKSSGKVINKIATKTESEYFNTLSSDGQDYYYYTTGSRDLYAPTYNSFYKNGKFVAKTNFTPNTVTPFLVNGNIYTFYTDRVEKHIALQDTLIFEQSIALDRHLRFPPNVTLVDRSGNLWIPGVDKITKLSFRPQYFKVYLKTKTDEFPRPIRGIGSRSDGTVYAGELDGLKIKNPKIEGKGFIPITKKYEGGFLGLLYDDNMLWAGHEHDGLALFDLKTNERFNYGGKLMWQPYKAPDGTIWVGAGKGLFKFDALQKELRLFQESGKSEELNKSTVYAFYFNDKGTWLSTSSGVYLVDLVQEKIVAHFSDTQTGAFYIPANHIAHIYEDKDGIFWLATKGQGLIRWNPESGKSEQLTRGNTGLSNNVIYAVYEDDFGNLWLPSDYGLNCLNKATRQVSLYLEEDGLPNNEFNTIAHHQDKEGNLYFGTIDGMIEFHPKDFNHEGENIPFIITAVNRIDQQTDSIINITKSVLDNHSLTIKPGDKAADISFALLDYKKTKGNQYSYKIEGYLDKWTYQKEANVRISGLPYGRYKLLLRGKASGTNNWIYYSQPINILVAKPFYMQWWFILSALLALVGSMFFIIKRNTRKLLDRQHELETVVEERTEEIRLQAEELKQLDKVKSNFFANISHELRTPLTLILGPLSYVLDHPEEWEKENIQQQLLVMQRNGKNLMDLIEEILDLSKLEANKLELQEEGTPLVQFFEYFIHVFEPQFQSQTLDYELIFEVNEDLHVLLDRKKMEKVLNNFLSNAIKFTPKNGKVTLKVIETDSDIHVIISDTGKGIHPKDLPYIFDRFYQSKQADQKLYGGTGIGLALVNEFAQLMGGKAYAESTLGAGSKFFFEIPKKEVAKKEILMPPTIDIQEEEIYSIGRDFTVLVVEDNRDMRDFIHQLLQKKYTRVLLANNGAEGLEVLKEQGRNINLIISDIMMPVVDGLTMLKEIKANPEWYDIPVIMLTALAAERDKLTALTIGVDDYLTKPFSVSELLIRVQNLLFNYNQRLEWQASEEFKDQHPEVSKKTVSQNTINAKDKEWVDELTTLVEQSFQEGTLDLESLAKLVFISSRQLNRKLKAITGLSAGKFIREVQLQAARKELESGTYLSISEVAYYVGFDNQSNFSRVFKSRFGKMPSAYLRKAS